MFSNPGEKILINEVRISECNLNITMKQIDYQTFSQNSTIQEPDPLTVRDSLFYFFCIINLAKSVLAQGGFVTKREVLV